MANFPDGMHWVVYGDGGFQDKSSLALEDKDGKQLTGVFKLNIGYIAMNLEIGSPIGSVEDFQVAVGRAEAEALSPSYPSA